MTPLRIIPRPLTDVELLHMLQTQQIDTVWRALYASAAKAQEQTKPEHKEKRA